MQYKTLEVKAEGPITRVWLNRPEKRNALNQLMIEEITDVFQRLQTSYDCRIVVLGGRGPSFCAGADRKETPGLPRMMDVHNASSRERRWLAKMGPRALDAIEQLDVVTIARVQGHVIGGGILLALACDFRVAAENTTFFFPEVELGTLLDWRGVPRMIYEVGPVKAREIVMGSLRFDAAQAMTWGMFNQVVSAEMVDSVIDSWVQRLLQVPQNVLETCKAQFRSFAATMRQGDATAFEADLFLSCMTDEKAKSSFRSK